MTVSNQAFGAGGRRVSMGVAAAQPGRGGAVCANPTNESRRVKLAALARSVGGVKILADRIGVNRGTLKHILDGNRPVPLKLWRSLAGVDAMTAALASLEKRGHK